MKKEWTKEEFIEECNAYINSKDPFLFGKQERRRIWLRRKRNQKHNPKSKAHGESKLQ